jgi:hypothetical protein
MTPEEKIEEMTKLAETVFSEGYNAAKNGSPPSAAKEYAANARSEMFELLAKRRADPLGCIVPILVVILIIAFLL